MAVCSPALAACFCKALRQPTRSRSENARSVSETDPNPRLRSTSLTVNRRRRARHVPNTDGSGRIRVRRVVVVPSCPVDPGPAGGLFGGQAGEDWSGCFDVKMIIACSATGRFSAMGGSDGVSIRCPSLEKCRHCAGAAPAIFMSWGARSKKSAMISATGV
jgi:hypothetical protein